MKVLIATPLYPPDIGGPATYAKTLETELPKRGVEVVVVSFHTVRFLPKGLAHLFYSYKLFQAARGADVILALDPVSVGLPAVLVALVRAKKFTVKIVGDYAWEQGVQRFGVKDNLDEFVKKPNSKFLAQVVFLRWIQKFVASRAQRVIVPSKYLSGIVAAWGIAPEKIAVVYNAFEGVGDVPDKEACRKEIGLSGTVILSAGRLVPWKGFATLIALMSELLKEFPDLKLLIAGVGPEEEKLHKCIADLKLDAAVILIGQVPHEKLLAYVRAADCFALNTAYEGLSHQLLETLALGTPIVTTHVGGNPEIIEEGVTGRLVPVNDSTALSCALKETLSDTPHVRTMAEAGKTFALQFTVSRMANETKTLLESL